MSNAKPYLFGLVLGASAMYVALQYHVVRSHDGFQMVPRTPQHSVGLAYADVRNWSPSQWTDRPELARALMAHGSSDLISESVAGSLADSVTEEDSTLDQLRSFLDKSTRGGTDDSAEELLRIPSSTQKPADLKSGTDDDLTRIPFPQDAKNKIAADPFRIAHGSNPPAASATEIQRTSPDAGTSRFSAADVIDGLRNDVGSRVDSVNGAAPRTTTAKTAPGSGSADTMTTSQQAQAMEERIFGRSTGSSTTSAQPLDPSGTSKTDSMFQEISTQLESRAQAALNRANGVTSSKTGSTADEVPAASNGYQRQRTEKSAPDMPKSVIENETFKNTTTSSDPLPDKFDPFLE